ncbi:uncharacterized protein LOC123549372 [Mercenaria mercenaria]|uniref:uncharacterized protein LOC123549372 n=1 Tax=Mercenaria mercenaria TaxID=6596 RepID=UPI00234F5313|nr:uncharacterized protein LOC123549372 [Mercenaria mercenaria]
MIDEMSFIKHDKTYEAVSSTNASVVYATVSGFAEKKAKYWFSDYVFVLEVYWTNKKTTYIKRSYDDVLNLYRDIKDNFNNKYEKGLIKSPVFIPKLEGKRFLQQSSVGLAEHREMELQSFFKQLLEGNPLISSNKIVLNFFCRRQTDPLPSETTEHSDNAEDENEDDDDDILFDR